jgi:hypothetical protein
MSGGVLFTLKVGDIVYASDGETKGKFTGTIGIYNYIV